MDSQVKAREELWTDLAARQDLHRSCAFPCCTDGNPVINVVELLQVAVFFCASLGKSVPKRSWMVFASERLDT